MFNSESRPGSFPKVARQGAQAAGRRAPTAGLPGRAFAQKACRDGYTALFYKTAELFREIAMAKADGRHAELLYELVRIDLLIVDDWGLQGSADGLKIR